MEDLKRKYREAALECADASADIAFHEAKAREASLRYNVAKRQRDELKAQIANFKQ